MTSTDFFDHIESALASKHPFVLFSKQDQQSIKAYIQSDLETHFINDFSESGFVFAPFDPTKETYYIPVEGSTILELEQPVFDISSNKNTFNEVESTDNHFNRVSKAIQEIKSTDLEKVVLSKEFKFSVEASNPIDIFKKLVQSYPSAFSYCWFHPQTGFWFGASPESLLKLEGKSLSTMALAGTQVFQSSEQVQWDAKNLKEHAFVTDYLLDVLSDYLDPIKTSGPHTFRAGELLHLQTHISGRLKSTDQSLKHLLRAIHPTPAVCGTPRPIALKFIHTNESYDRAFYAGFFGELNVPTAPIFRNSRKNIENRAYQTVRKFTHLAVNLRCMSLKDSQAVLYGGGGITEDSDPEAECIEIQNKIQTIKKVF